MANVLRPLPWVLICGALAACGGGSAPPVNDGPAAIVGQVKVSEDTLASSGVALIRGTPLGSPIGAEGAFHVTGVPPGSWTLEILLGGEFADFPPFTKSIGVNPNEVRDLGAIELFSTGFVGGSVVVVSGSAESTLVGALDSGNVTAALNDGTYLLSRVSPGVHDIVAVQQGSSVTKSGVQVLPEQVTALNFDFANAETLPAEIIGHAQFMDGQTAGIEVRLLLARDGTLVESTVVDEDGNFSFVAPPAAYVVRALRAGSVNQTSIPSGALGAGRRFRVNLLLSAGDADGDGIPDESDPDIDNDGVPNEEDAFPYDPRESQDSDGDSIGDRSDPDTAADTDRDGIIDSSDNCLVVDNVDQIDIDGDVVGDACDNCQAEENSDQTDADSDTIGDVCDNCPTVANANQNAAACSSTCSNDGDCGGLRCKIATGVCVECLSGADCDDSLYCNGTEVCNAVNQCRPGVAPALSDGVACTVDACDEIGNVVTHSPSSALCSDGDRCTLDVCNPVSGCSHDGAILIFDQTGGVGYLDGIADALGLEAIITGDEVGFVNAFDAGGFGVILIEAPSALGTPALDRISTWVEARQPIVISAATSIHNDSAFAATLGVSSVGLDTGTSPISESSGSGLFSLTQNIPALVIASFNRSRVALSLATAGITAATYASSQGAVLVTNGQSTVVNGVSVREFFDESTDNDTDTVNDGGELAVNEVDYVCSRPSHRLPHTVAAGAYHSCALNGSGQIRCWGSAVTGQLGYGNLTTIGDDESPATAGYVSIGGTAVEVVAGDYHTCARLSTGAVRCWGSASVGQLGTGNTNKIGDNELPSSIAAVSLGGTAIGLAAGDSHTCALLSTGQVRCWGHGGFGRLGLGHTSNVGDNETPGSLPVVNLGGTAIQITAGNSHTCALLTDGTVRCWGDGAGGRLGYGNTDDIGDNEAPASVSPVNLGGVAVDIAAGDSHTCALLDNGTVKCWGQGASGRLGNGLVTDIGDNETPASAAAITIGGFVGRLEAGFGHTCAVLDGGTLRCFGEGSSGQLGTASTSDVGDNETPASVSPVSAGGAVIEVSAGHMHSCVRLAGGAVRCFGLGGNGQLGTGSTATIGDNEAPSTAPLVPL